MTPLDTTHVILQEMNQQMLQIVIDVTTGEVHQVQANQLLEGRTDLLPEDSMRAELEAKESPIFCVLELENGDCAWVDPVIEDDPIGEC